MSDYKTILLVLSITTPEMMFASGSTASAITSDASAHTKWVEPFPMEKTIFS